ncbi:protein of unknown function DUF11 [Belliella baltica DSM 15883]|uniref:Uncharacterized protein n=1 Tax=Belliella baltica (strain DSM 15883 / CIP 108006 / LMG 21964 / BA134) TaxID=866536 RepID=I3ZAJ2_BELBD|nr:T9SS C-terminal target domain-containing protein [Belliella baltica]AFL86260.1 protein of unknown function DUF11 [Belliella baltica DSM 15883]
MENIYNFLKNIRFAVLAVVLVLFGGNLPTATAQTQNVKPFVKRVGTPQPPNGVFNVRGDYTLVGNTNLTLQNYSDGGNNSSNVMVYVDVDGNPQTVNSSSANLVFSQENGADPNCSEILYAGLYWSGRATPGLGNTFDVTKGEVPGTPQQVNNVQQQVFHNDPINFSNYSLGISRVGGNNNRSPLYTLEGDGDVYQFEFNNSTNNRVGWRVGTNGSFTPVSNLNVTTSGGVSTATFDPVSITIDGVTFSVSSLRRNSSNNGNSNSYTNSNNSLTLTANGTFTPMVPNTVTLDKRKVKLKGPGSASYTELTANANNILYPQGAQADIYAGYVDVTNYVKQNGIGEYTVADIALVEGNGGLTGYFGQWGIIVVYENSKMPWRDITIFDGYSFVQSPGNSALSTGEFDITGFNAVQNGPVNLKLGVLAGEGDVGITGDFLEIRNAANSNWVRLSHPLNTTNNFFNSTIYTPVRDANDDLVSNPRSPNLLNNTGIDIAMWDVPNPNNSIIGNSQTSTRFRYGTTQDLYSIYMVAFSVDAYVPDVEGLNLLTSLNGNPAGINPTVQPGEDITYTLEIRNRGTEAVQDLEVVIPIPFTASFSGDLSDIISQVNFSGGNAQSPIFDPTAGSTGSIIWKINNLPLPASGDPNDVLATLTYTLQATENCFVLAQADCEAFIETGGILRGKGAVSQSTFNSVPFITGFNNDGSCEGEPISTPVRINIVNALDWVQTNCQGANLELDFFFCNVTAGIPVTEIRGNFPTGTQFFSGPDPLNDTEFNENNPFPSTGGQFFAIPPNSSECVFQFDIIVTIVTTNPDIPTSEDLTFCQGENAGNLSQFISLSADGLANDYQLFYFTEPTGGNAISNPVINTSNSGEVTFWVAEGPSSSCIGDRVPVTITVNPNTAEPAVLNVNECQQEGTVPYNVTALPNATLLFYADNNPGSLPFEATPAVDLSIAGINTVWVSQVVDGLCESARVPVSITVNPLPVLTIADPAPVCEPGTVDLTAAAVTAGSSGFDVLEYFSNVEGTDVLTNPDAIAQSGTYYIKATSSNDCFVIKPVEVIVNDAPVAPISAGDITVCAADPIQTLDANDAITAVTGITYKWYTAATGGSEVIPTLSSIGTATFYVEAVSEEGCASLERTAVTLTINDCSVAITKTVDFEEIDKPTTLNYTIRVTNPGNTPLTGVVVTDPLTNEATPLALFSGDDNNDGKLDTGESWVYNASYAVDQDMIDAGADIVNTAIVNTDFTGEEEASVTTMIDQTPGLAITKAAALGSSYEAVGDEIDYTITVTNTGNVTLSNIVVADPLTGLNQTIATLAPKASEVINTTYTVDQDDIDAGSVTNVATATVGDITVSDDEEVDAVQTPGLAITKAAALGSSYEAVGDEIDYTITVTNTGNVTLSNIVVADPLTGLNQTIATLAPKASEVINTTYTVDQDDIDAGSVTNVATATVGDITVSDDEEVDAVQTPGLAITKAAALGSSYEAVGDEIDYTITVTNTGNVTLSNIVVADPLTGLNQTIATLAPKASEVINTTYTVDQDDIDAGSVTNVATATVGDITVSDDEEVDAVQIPGLAITKAAALGSSYEAVGDEIDYTITVTNTGNVTLSNIVVADPLTGLNQTIATLAPKASEVINTTYTVDQDDIDAGSVTNVATATVGDITVSDDEEVDAVQNSAIAIAKSANKTIVTAAGEEVVYTLTVTNTGNTTLTDVMLVDAMLEVSENVGTLLPGQSASRDYTYTVTQADIDNGSIVNVANTTGEDPNGDMPEDDATVTVDVDQRSAITIAKSANKTVVTESGEEVVYTLTVTNTGNTTLTDVMIVDAMLEVSENVGTLLPGQSASRDYTYTVTQSDIDNGSIVNVATVTSEDPNGDTPGDDDEVTVDVDQNSSVALTKSADKSVVTVAGEEVVYTLTVTNTGNTTLTDVMLVDEMLEVSENVGTLLPGQSVSRDYTYTVTQSDIDNGSIVNVASTTGEDPNGDMPEDDATVTVDVDQNSAISLAKSANKTVVSEAGEEVVYTLTVTNTGNTTLTDVMIVDAMLEVSENVGTLLPGQSESRDYTYTVTQSDIDNGSIVNVASTTGEDPNGDMPEDDATVTVDVDQNSAISLAKSADKSVVTVAGEEVVYTLTVTNTGNTTLTDVMLVDEMLEVSENVGTLLPGQSESRDYTYTVTQSDIDNGSIVNVASTTGEDPNGDMPEDDATVTVDVDQNSAISLAKSADKSVVTVAGEEVVYTLTVTNTGNTTLTDVMLVDEMLEVSENVGTLLPGQSESRDYTYTVTQADIDNGSIVNVANTTGEDPNGDMPEDDATVTVDVDQNSAITIAKSANKTVVSEAGEEVVYTLTVTNTGNTTLTDVMIVDAMLEVSENVGTLLPGQSESRDYTYTVTQADIDNGSIVNVATTEGEDPNGDMPEDDATVTVDVDQRSAITIAKSANKTAVTEAGEEVVYTLTVTNTGNTTLTDVMIVDAMLNVSENVGTLLPGQSESRDYTYTVTQADIDNGSIVNVANTTGEDPNGDMPEDDATVTVDVDQRSAITIAKSANKTVVTESGEEVVYTLTVTNTGNTTLTDVMLVDEMLEVSENVGTLLPGQSVSRDYTYTVTQSDIDNGSIVNVASTTGEDPNGDTPGDDDEVTVDVDQNSSVALTKSADKSIVTAAGEEVVYTLTVTNTGNTTLTDVMLVDAMLEVSENVGTLLPGQSASRDYTYTVTQADIDNGSIVNVANTTGEDPNGDMPEDDATVTVDVDQNSAITIAKSANKTVVTEAGEEVVYTLTVTNTGNTTLTDVMLVDEMLEVSENVGTLLPGQSVSRDYTYTVTQSDIDNGSIVNVASTTGEDPNGDTPGDDDEVTVDVDQNSSVALTKSADKSIVTAAGEEVVYTLTVTNTGNTTLTDVMLVDEMLEVSENVGTLLPGQSVSRDYTYTVTQSDIDNGSIVNVASTEGEDPNGDTPGDDDEVTVDVDQNSSVALTKSADKSIVTAAGEEVVYTLTVTNTGNTTLTDVMIVDAMLNVSENVGTLLPGQSASRDYTYTVTQTDIDNGSIVNVASTEGEDPNGDTPGDDDEVTVDVDQNSSVALAKSADKSVVTAAGEEVVYTLTVTNTGNTTLTDVMLVDEMLEVSENVGTLLPGQSESRDYTYTVTQTDIDNGSIVNVASTTGEDPNGDKPGDEATVTVDVDQRSAIIIAKSANKTAVTAAGEEVVYTLTVTNTGNTTLTDVMLVDAMLNVSENVGTLLPGQSESREYTYTVTQADIDNGSIVNVATTEGENPNGETPEDGDEVIVEVDQRSAITIAKSANKTVVSEAGEEVVYTLTVTNTGNTTLTDVMIVDAMLNVSENVGTLLPGASASREYTYTVTQADIDNGSIVNVATTEGEDPNGETPEDGDEVIVEVDQRASIEIVKTTQSTTYLELGEVINYTLTVTNTGSVTLTNVEVIDPLTGFTNTIESLSPGQVISLATSYTITADDLERGTLLNTASVSAEIPDGGTIGDEDSVTIGGGARPIIANDDEYGEFTVSFGGEIGNILDNDLLDGQPVTMDNVDFVFTELDGIIGLLINPNGELSLIPGVNEARDYRLRYVLSETLNPTNSDEAFVTFRILNDEVDMSVTKTSFDVEVFEGDEFEYEIVVRNNSENDASDVEIVDDLPNGLSYISSTITSSDASIQASTTTAGNRITWTVPTFPAGATMTIRVLVKADALPGTSELTVTNVVSVSSSGEELNPTDNTDSDTNTIKPFFIPNVITPNGDNRNDRFEIKGLDKFTSNEIVIFNRFGDHVFERTNYQNDWSAEGLPAGTYFMVLVATDSQGRTHDFKEWIQVIKE